MASKKARACVVTCISGKFDRVEFGRYAAHLGSREQNHELSDQVVVVTEVSRDIMLQLEQVIRSRAEKRD